jgi:hypothetical protein
MNQQQVTQFVERYLETTQCQIIEKSPAHITVKLSPEADKALTNRSYYWSFVERTGAEPETMTFSFIFDSEAMETAEQRQRKAEEARKPKQVEPPQQNDSILGRYFGFTPTTVQYNPGQPRKEQITYGSGRLEQIFRTVKEAGRCVNLFEQPAISGHQRMLESLAYSSWLCVNYKVALECEMKRDEIHSLGISLSTGEIVTAFHEKIQHRTLSPKLPANTHVRQTISLPRAVSDLERYIERLVRTYDHSWAEEANDRLLDELGRIDSYYEVMRAEAKDEDQLALIITQHEARRSEVEWQHRPRIQASVINCGLFHLLSVP